MEKPVHPIEADPRPWFGKEEDDAAWKAWVDEFHPTLNKLLDLVMDRRVRLEFKARALVVLFSPMHHVIPVYWNSALLISGNHKVAVRGLQLEYLRSDLRNFVCELLVYAIKCLRIGYPDGAWRRSALQDYNEYLLYFVASELSEERFWDLFQINDPDTYRTEESVSGYTPWYKLMLSYAPAGLKVLADGAFRKVIDAELAGQARPREQWEGALDCYIKHINALVYKAEQSRDDNEDGWNATMPYDIALLADQLQYLLSKEEVKGRQIIEPGNCIYTVLDLLSHTRYREVRAQFIRHALAVPAPNDFTVCNPETQSAARTMLDIFQREGRQDVDGALMERLEKMIAEGSKRVESDQRRHREHWAIFERLFTSS